MKLFVDTWGWLTLYDKRELKHKEVVAFWERFHKDRGVLYTTDYILTETYTLLFKRLDAQRAKNAMQELEENITKGRLRFIWMTPERFEKTVKLRLRYEDKPKISFTDLSSMVVMQELSINWVLTADDHFTHVGMGFQLKP
jgi:predicted nucleic acid-binding protein